LVRFRIISLYRNSQLFRNSVLSLSGWLLMYLVFLFEVIHLDWSSQHAKLSITPIGIPIDSSAAPVQISLSPPYDKGFLPLRGQVFFCWNFMAVHYDSAVR